MNCPVIPGLKSQEINIIQNILLPLMPSKKL